MNTENKVYSVVLSEIKENEAFDTVVDRLSILFKTSPEKVKHILNYKNFIVKKKCNLEDAMKYKNAIEKNGINCLIVNEEESFDIDVNVEHSAKNTPILQKNKNNLLFNPEDNLIEYNKIRTKYSKLARMASTDFDKNFYKYFSNADDLYQNINNIAFSYVEKILHDAISILIKEFNSYDISVESFIDDFLSQTSSFNNDVSEFNRKYESIIEESESIDKNAQARHENRARWESNGGYGISGAIKGELKAGALNFITDLANEAFNAAEKANHNKESNQKKVLLFTSDATRYQLTKAIYNICFDIHKALIVAINSLSDVKIIFELDDNLIEKTNRIFNNIKAGLIPEKDRKYLLINAMKINPYNHEYYMYWIDCYGFSDVEFRNTVSYFDINEVELYKKKKILEKINTICIDGVNNFDAANKQLKAYAHSMGYICDESDLQELNKKISKITDDVKNIEDNNKDKTSLDVDSIINGFSSNAEEHFYVRPNLPEKKIRHFLEKSKYSINYNEIVFYFDDTVFGKGDCGVLICINFIDINVSFQEEELLSISDILDVSISGVLNKTIKIKTKNRLIKFELTQSNSGAKLIFDAIKKLLN